jgi:hypothetical protein
MAKSTRQQRRVMAWTGGIESQRWALRLAFERRDIESVRSLVASGANLNEEYVEGGDGSTFLHAACETDDAAFVEVCGVAWRGVAWRRPHTQRSYVTGLVGP